MTTNKKLSNQFASRDNEVDILLKAACEVYSKAFIISKAISSNSVV